MRKLLLISALALLAPSAASAADLSGAWKIVADVGGMMVDVGCTFTQQGANLTGTCARTDTPGEKPAAVTGTLDGSTVKWAYDVTFNDMPLHVAYTGQATSDTAMTGTIDVLGTSGTFTASK